jgi:serine phosphatase RsbU (regulator of sigma subunit)
MTSTFTSELREEFEQERERWLRKRFIWYTVVVLVLSALGLIGGMLPLFGVGLNVQGESPEETARLARLIKTSVVIMTLLSAVGIAMYLGALLHVRRRLLDRESILRIVFWLIVINGVLGFAGSIVQVEFLERVAQSARGGVSKQGFASISLLWSIFLTHVFACLFLPWTPRESIRPIAPLLVLHAILVLVYAGGWVGPLVAITLSPLVAVPGALICMWRQSRFHSRFQLGALKRRYGEMRQELTDARRIHEALFPKPVLEGAVRLDYRYEPMRQIGGDYLYSRFSPSPRGDKPALSVVILDVTGHGIPAALTVNRLHGELDRLFAEHPDSSPGRILVALNRYIHLTLATHSVYVTALCVRVDPNPAPGADQRVGALEWASGGHPPAFVRAVDGQIHRLDSTAFVLGAAHGDDFQHGQESMPFGPGDVLIAYTDGATEARDRNGRMLRIDGLQRIVATLNGQGGVAADVLQRIDEHRFGPPADDTLVVEISVPLSV